MPALPWPPFRLASRLAAGALAIALGACAADPPVDPLRDPSLLPPVSMRGVVRKPLTLRLAPVADDRGLAGGDAAIDRSFATPAAEVVEGYLAREIERAGLFRDVVSGEAADLELHTSIAALDGGASGSVASASGAGSVALRVRVTRTADGALLLDERYEDRVTERRLLAGAPDPAELTCRALARVTEDLLRDLDRLDAAGPGGGAGS